MKTKPGTANPAAALLAVANAIVESVAVAGAAGAPSGLLYAALMGHGVSLENYQIIMGVLVETGKLRKAGDLYFAVQS